MGTVLGYDLTQFEGDIQQIRPRFFDTYVLPPFLVWYAMKSKGMGRNTRRMLFSAGIYMFYRNYAQYKSAYEKFTAMLQQSQQTPSTVESIS